MKRSIAAVLSLTVSGCSLLFTHGPGPVGKPPQTYARCTESNTIPIVDAVIGGLLVLSAAGAFGTTQDENASSDTADQGTAATISGLLLAGVFGVSAFVGVGRTKKCRASHQEYVAAHPQQLQPIGPGYIPQPIGPGYVPPQNVAVGAQGGSCTAQLGCDPGLVCAGMPDHTNRCMKGHIQQVAPPPPAIGMQGGACTAQLTCEMGLQCAGMPDRTNKCMPARAPVVPTPPPPPAIGMQGGTCTAQMTCNTGLVCAGMPDRSNKCIPAPSPGTHGGSCRANNACNAGLMCAGMPDHTNKCMPSQ